MVVIVFGLPGSGKSFFAERLAAELGADYINTDRVRKEMFPKPSYSDEEKSLLYKKLLDEVYHHAHARKVLVLDGTFHLQKIRADFIKLSSDLNIDLKWIEVIANDDLIKERLSKEREYSDADYSIHKLIKEEYEPFSNDDHIKIKRLTSTNNNINQMLTRAKIFLTTKNTS